MTGKFFLLIQFLDAVLLAHFFHKHEFFQLYPVTVSLGLAAINREKEAVSVAHAWGLLPTIKATHLSSFNSISFLVIQAHFLTTYFISLYSILFTSF